MSHDYTQQQSSADEQRSRRLSVEHTRPPTEVPGYHAERFLGAGAYGEVWVGVDRNTGRRVAIKFFAHRRGVDWSLLSREVEKLVFLSADRYVVQLIEVGWEADPPYYVMEYVESGSLEDLLRAEGTMAVGPAVDMFREICTGLAHAHGKGVLHCDLKPENILLDQDHRPRLADFGQSRLTNDQTPALGTLFYMAPEQADLAAVPDVRWDVYALGAILYSLLVGTPPFRNETVTAQLDTAVDLSDRLARYRQAMADSPPPAAHRRVHGVDRPLAEIIERCLEVDPSQRYASVQEIISDLNVRQHARQMRPLFALGFIFPIVMLGVMALFGWRGYKRALRETESLAVQRAEENSTFAAQLAAERVATEIEEYFRIAQDEVDRPVFREFFETIREHPLLGRLADTDMAPEETLRLQEQFLVDEERLKLDAYLARRLGRYRSEPKLASIFAVDAKGTQIAAAYEGDDRAQSIGRNFAFRSYFHGGPGDLPRETRVPAVKPVRQTHLSAVFQSSTTKKWKVAIATPIVRETEDTEELVGLFVITVNLGDFEFFRTVQDLRGDRFAVLVDGRPGESTGLILQHPLFDRVLAQHGTLPESFRARRVPLTNEGGLSEPRYRDPLGEEPLGEAFRREWLAAAAPVRSVNESRSESSTKSNPSGLVVLVQEDFPAVILPVRRLGERLIREGVLAFVAMALVTALIWFAVLRLVRETRSTARPRLLPLRDSTPNAFGSTLPTTAK